MHSSWRFPIAADEVQLSFIGGAEVDRYGNLNTSVIGDWRHPSMPLPGSGGGSDIASLSQRLAIIMQHDRRSLPRGGPAAPITTLAVFTFDPYEQEIVDITLKLFIPERVRN